MPAGQSESDRGLADEIHCYLSTTGRRSGRPHTIEIWFVLSDRTVYMLSGKRDRADWVRNSVHDPAVSICIKDRSFPAQARLTLSDTEDQMARRLMRDKYSRTEHDFDWAASALPIAFDLAPEV